MDKNIILPKIIFLFGLPGSGKGTQANILADKFGFFHFDTGKEIEKTVHDSALQNDPVIKHERVLFETGFLNTPSWVEELVKTRVADYLKKGEKVVFSGSPRTLSEVQGLLPVLEKYAGKNNLLALLIEDKEETSIFRNSHRRVCDNCRTPVMWSGETENLTKCTQCGGRLIKRVLDAEDIIRERIREYRTRTEPAIDFLRRSGVRIINIDGEISPEEVADSILENLK